MLLLLLLIEGATVAATEGAVAAATEGAGTAAATKRCATVFATEGKIVIHVMPCVSLPTSWY